MGVHLPRAPLLEAIFELRVSDGLALAGEQVEALVARLAARYPERKVVEDVSINLTPSGAEHRVGQRHQLTPTDKSLMVQVTASTVTVNHLRDYVRWPGFREAILEVAADFLTVAPNAAVSRLGLRYINGLPLEGRAVAELITLPPPTTSLRSGSLASFYQRYEFAHAAGMLIHQTALVGAPSATVMLDLDFGSLHDGALRPEALGPFLETAHDHIEKAFISSLAPPYYRSLQEEPT